MHEEWDAYRIPLYLRILQAGKEQRMNIGNQIAKYRKKSGMTQAELAEKMEVSFQAVSSWERNEYVPDTEKLFRLGECLQISVPVLLGTEKEIEWELSDRMFSEEHMYTFVRSAAHSRGLVQAGRVLPLAKQLHKGQTRKGKDKVPYISHPLMMACHALALGFDEDDILSAILLHDVCEDCAVALDELPVNDVVQEVVSLLTFVVENGETEEQAKKRYYDGIRKNRIATVVKVLDRCNNISTMAVAFPQKKMVEYINETEIYVLPLLDRMKHEYPEFYNGAFLIKYQMLSILESMKRVISG